MQSHNPFFEFYLSTHFVPNNANESSEETYFYFIFTGNFSDDSTVPVVFIQCTTNLCGKSKADNQRKFIQNKYSPYIS